MRHADPATTLKRYQKTIPASQRMAVEELDKKFPGKWPRVNSMRTC